MRKFTVVASALVISLFCLSALAADASDVSGTLTAPDGAPLPNVSVALFSCQFAPNSITGRMVGQATTDAQGKFRFANALQWTSAAQMGAMPPRYCVYATPKETGIAYANIQQGQPSENIKLQATTREVLPISVTDTDGKPVSDARVCIVNSVSNSREMLLIPPEVGLGERTNSEGKADLLVPPGAQMTAVLAQKDGYAMGLGEKEITLSPGGTVTGTVLSSEGKPVVGAKVSYVTTRVQTFDSSSAVTDAAGAFELKNVPAEGYSVSLRGQKQVSNGEVALSVALPNSSAQSGNATVMVKPGQTTSQNITLQPNLELSGNVVDADTAQPLSGIRLRMFAHARRGGRAENLTAITDQDGKFTFYASPNVAVQVNCEASPDGEYVMDQQWQGQRGFRGFNTQNLTESKTDVKILLKLRALAPLAGKVVDESGKPVADANVTIDANLRPAKTDAEGKFSYKAAPTDRPGQAVVSATGVGAVAPFAAGQKEITITAHPLATRDCVVVTPDGAPAENLTFTLMLQSGDPRGAYFTYSQANALKPNQTDAEGKCRLEGLIPGASYLAAWQPKGDYGNGNARFTVDPAGTPVRFTAAKYNNTFGLIVENEDGDPVPDARLQFQNYSVIKNQDWGRLNGLKTNAEGSLRLEGIAGGVIDFEIMADNYRRHRVSIPVSEKEYVATLTKQDSAPRHTIIVMANGKPMPDLLVRVFHGRAEEKSLKTDANGRLVMPMSADRNEGFALCQHPDYGWGVANLPWYQDGVVTMVLRKPATPRKVHLVTIDGKPVPNAMLTLVSLASQTTSETIGGIDQRSLYGMPESVRDELGFRQVTDTNGMATFALADSRLMCSFQIESKEFGNQNKGLGENGSPEGDEIRIQKLGKITGTIKIPPEAKLDPNRFNVQARLVGQMGTVGGTGVQQDGWFEMQIEPGEYQVFAMSYGGQGEGTRYMVRNRPVVKVGSGETKEVELEVKEGIPVRGKYVSKDGKLPNPLPKLGIQIEDGMGFNPKPLNADGSFEFFVPAPGEYQVLVEMRDQPNSYRTSSSPIKVPSDKPVENAVVKEE